MKCKGKGTEIFVAIGRKSLFWNYQVVCSVNFLLQLQFFSNAIQNIAFATSRTSFLTSLTRFSFGGSSSNSDSEGPEGSSKSISPRPEPTAQIVTKFVGVD